MSNRLYYNPASATGDPRTGMGYGKAQKIPSIGTGYGSEQVMGYKDTGIYVEPPEDLTDEELEDNPISDEDLDAFAVAVNLDYQPAGRYPGWPRADRSSLGSSQNWNPGPLAERDGLPKARTGPAPFSPSVLYPKGFDGPPMGTGGAGQAFRTTGNYRRTGTQYGTSRAPIDIGDEDDDLKFYTAVDVINMPEDEKNFLKWQIKIKKLLDVTECLVRR